MRRGTNQMRKTMKTEPTIALSIRQPWAWLILNAGKDIENRSWPTKVRGRVLIHAGKGMTREEYEAAEDFYYGRLSGTLGIPAPHELQRGGIVGEVEITRCVADSESPWFVGEFGFVLAHPKPLPFRACKGALGFFHVP
jgi:hypothetical protein